MDFDAYKILVPHDFSAIADNAIAHAAKLAKSFNGGVYLLNVVGKAKEVSDAKEKLNKIADAAASQYGIDIIGIVRIGNIFEDIGDAASEIGAGYIVMGTHGAKGMQKIMGSHALKVISHSKIPFIIVQEKGPSATDAYDDVCVPIDYSDVTKQKLQIAADIAKHFGSKIHIFSAKESDEFLQVKLDRELKFARNYFDERDVKYDIVSAENSGNFKQQLIKHAAKIDADMIAIVNTREGALLPDMFGSDEQEVIANDSQTPVLITNPTQKVVAGGVIGS